MSSKPLADAAAPTAEELRAVFDEPSELTLGLEEEVMLLDSETLDLAPRAAEVLAALGGDARFKAELPAAQLEILTPPVVRVAEATEVLAAGRRRLGEMAGRGLVRAGAAGVHPFAAARGVLHGGERYDGIHAEYGPVAERQLVGGLQVHVAVRPGDRALAVYNALRSYLPEIAALAANAPFYEGVDSGLASVRPLICGMLPRQGVPPAIPSWEAWVEALRWGAAAGAVPEPRRWWWELRPHAAYGTLEIRVPDAQVTVVDAAGVAALVHSLVGRLAARYDAGEELPVAPSWRIAENRWSACRHGLSGRLADLATGEPVPTRERLRALLEELGPTAGALGCAEELRDARRLVEAGGAERQRAVAAERGVRGLTEWLVESFGAESAGSPPPRLRAEEGG